MCFFQDSRALILGSKEISHVSEDVEIKGLDSTVYPKQHVDWARPEFEELCPASIPAFWQSVQMLWRSEPKDKTKLKQMNALCPVSTGNVGGQG